MENGFVITKIDRVIFVGKNEYLEKTTSFTENLSSNELIFHISGKSAVIFNGKTLSCEPDCIRFLPKGKNNGYKVIREELGDCIDVFFKSDKPLSAEAFCQRVNNASAVSALFKKLFSVWVAKNDGYYFECISLLYKIFSELQKQTYISKKQYSLIKPAVEYINQYFYTQKLSVSQLAELCGISESYLKKLFIKSFGVPPVKYIIQLKINYACDLLKTKMYSVNQTAALCGYESCYYFSRQFKSLMGISPTAFIEKYKSSK